MHPQSTYPPLQIRRLLTGSSLAACPARCLLGRPASVSCVTGQPTDRLFAPFAPSPSHILLYFLLLHPNPSRRASLSSRFYSYS
ncbi:hypothetical protein EJ06DRAFT_423513 [Trichodelitschia bisporula]|uniref:Uncharacterized protein n=1 Tax=Trichodelitschia bisporula TaxID=703511 RepID=A0A6G1HWF0_9PEZI|nr:hypothetical protein EJ06DRAFT_423513 [Trichodelitschia bisporula]